MYGTAPEKKIFSSGRSITKHFKGLENFSNFTIDGIIYPVQASKADRSTSYRLYITSVFYHDKRERLPYKELKKPERKDELEAIISNVKSEMANEGLEYRHLEIICGRLPLPEEEE